MSTPVITNQTQLKDLLDYAKELKQDKLDFEGNAREFYFLDDGTLTSKPKQGVLFGNAMAPGRLTDHALKQAFGKLGKAYSLNSLGSDHMQALAAVEPDLFAMNMNRAIARLPETECWMVRTNKGDVRAVLSDEYLIIDNDDMLGWLWDVMVEDGTPHFISPRSFLNPDNMTIDIIFKDINTGEGNGNGNFKTGVRIKNGETGKWQGGIFPLAMRTSCWNSVAVDLTKMSYTFKHYGKKTLAAKKTLLKSNMLEVLPHAEAIVAKQIEAEYKNLPSFAEAVGGLAIKHGWSEEFVGNIWVGSEGRTESLAGLVNGITFAAHTKAPNPEAMVEAEFLAGAILFDDNMHRVQEAVYTYNSKTERDRAREARKQNSRKAEPVPMF